LLDSTTITLPTDVVTISGDEGNVKWIYQGHPQINTEYKPFDPKDIVTTSVGNVIVVESNNHTIHAISGGGELLTYKVMSDHGVKLPLSLYFVSMFGSLTTNPFQQVDIQINDLYVH
jgi:hypothetical protein